MIDHSQDVCPLDRESRKTSVTLSRNKALKTTFWYGNLYFTLSQCRWLPSQNWRSRSTADLPKRTKQLLWKTSGRPEINYSDKPIQKLALMQVTKNRILLAAQEWSRGASSLLLISSLDPRPSSRRGRWYTSIPAMNIIYRKPVIQKVQSRSWDFRIGSCGSGLAYGIV